MIRRRLTKGEKTLGQKTRGRRMLLIASRQTVQHISIPLVAPLCDLLSSESLSSSLRIALRANLSTISNIGQPSRYRRIRSVSLLWILLFRRSRPSSFTGGKQAGTV